MRTEWSGERVRMDRGVDHVEIVLTRPERHNALDTVMRDELVQVLRAIIADAEVFPVCLFGDGPSFSSGGDLTEFGTSTGGGSGHLQRLSRHLPSLLWELSDRLVVGVHGACIGAGVELAAVAGLVIAAEDATFRLPEVEMGLIPGAGGTVSIPRRIGRQRALWLMITGSEIKAPSALEWGLVDEVVPQDDLRARVRAAALTI